MGLLTGRFKLFMSAEHGCMLTDLAGRPPLGQKARKPPKSPRKAIQRRSAKMTAHKAAEHARGGTDHMMAVKALPCVCCHAPPPSEAHHVKDGGKARSDFRVIPLCYECHRGQHGYHNAKRSWRARYGLDCDLLPIVDAMLGRKTPGHF